LSVILWSDVLSIFLFALLLFDRRPDGIFEQATDIVALDLAVSVVNAPDCAARGAFRHAFLLDVIDCVAGPAWPQVDGQRIRRR
jgi:hypothetical protein